MNLLHIINNRITQGYRTTPYPVAENPLPTAFRGLPHLATELCVSECRACSNCCPTQAITLNAESSKLQELDLGRCIFCGECQRVCPEGAISFGSEYKLASTSRAALTIREAESPRVTKLRSEMLRVFGRSLKLRQVSAGGCNACEAELNVLSTVVFDLERFGIQFVASPRHADGLVVSGAVSKNMLGALLKTYEAIPEPKLVIAVGACAISGGPYIDSPEVQNGADHELKVDLYIPGCPPHPLTILDGLLRWLDKL